MAVRSEIVHQLDQVKTIGITNGSISSALYNGVLYLWINKKFKRQGTKSSTNLNHWSFLIMILYCLYKFNIRYRQMTPLDEQVQ